MYYDFYGFSEPPFNITPDPKYLFFSDQHREALNHLLFGIQERKGFIQLTGEVGSGKTTTCRAFFNHLDPEKYITALILNPVLTPSEMLRAILYEMNVPGVSDDHLKNYSLLNAFLLKQVKAGVDVVLVIDEAQNLSMELLEQVRLLSNLETDNQKLIQIILMGQPELKRTLEDPSMRQLRQRITVRYHLGALSKDETRRYLEHRMTVAGSKGVPRFDTGAVNVILRKSGGIPRMINALADKALLAGYVFKTERITRQLVKLAAKELDGDYA
ncbi:MAG: AAA family ATPase [Lentisphaeria bacterium]|nr:AAA family ATPase [Lentisphaeria bacterium]